MVPRNRLVYAIWFFMIVPIAYLVIHISEPQFVSNFMGNWAATTLGVILGIPGAIAISRWQQEEQDKRGVKEAQKRKWEHQRKVLELIRIELKANQDELDWLSHNHMSEQRLPGFSDQLWQAFSDSGEIQWIDDLDLLDRITQAYLYIRALIKLDVAQDTLINSNAQFQEPMIGMQGRRIIEGRNTLHPNADQWIRQAVEAIENQLHKTVLSSD